MAPTVFVPLSAKLIDEGEFIGDLDLELRSLQQSLAEFRQSHGEKSKGAIAKLQIEIALKIEDVEDDAYSVKVAMKSTLPKRPAMVSLAMGGTDDDGRRALFVRKSGSDGDLPKQLKLATRDGRVIDQETGEALD